MELRTEARRLATIATIFIWVGWFTVIYAIVAGIICDSTCRRNPSSTSSRRSGCRSRPSVGRSSSPCSLRGSGTSRGCSRCMSEPSRGREIWQARRRRSKRSVGSVPLPPTRRPRREPARQVAAPPKATERPIWRSSWNSSNSVVRNRPFSGRAEPSASMRTGMGARSLAPCDTPRRRGCDPRCGCGRLRRPGKAEVMDGLASGRSNALTALLRGELSLEGDRRLLVRVSGSSRKFDRSGGPPTRVASSADVGGRHGRQSREDPRRQHVRRL